MIEVLAEFRQSARSLRRAPGFTLAVIATLGLGIGATTAMFSVVNGVLLRPLPYPDPGRIVRLVQRFANGTGNPTFSEPEFLALTEQAKSFSALAAVDFAGANLRVAPGDEPEPAVVLRGSGGLSAVLGLGTALGRPLGESDARPGAPPVAVISQELWRRRFAAANEVIGSRLRLDGVAYTVVGVLPGETPFLGPRADLWTPLQIDAARFDRNSLANHNRLVVARRRPTVVEAELTTDLAAAAAGLGAKYPQEYSTPVTFGTVSLLDALVGDRRRALLLFLGAVGLVLLIACVNAANLFLMRAERRRGERAVRVALGAGRGRLLRTAVMESLLVGLAAGAAGVIAAALGRQAVLAWLPADLPRRADIALDLPVCAFAGALALVTALVCGLLPALSLLRRERALGVGRLHAGVGVGRLPARRLLVIAETALALVLTVGAGLLLRSFAHLLDQPPGFEPRQVVSVGIDLPRSSYRGAAQSAELYARGLERVATLPGVEAAAIAVAVPLNGDSSNWAFEVEGRPEAGITHAFYNLVSRDYFRTLRVPVLRGRAFSAEDERRPEGAVVINQTLAAKLWPGQNPLGQRVNLNLGPPVWREIVGVVGDVRSRELGLEAGTQIYLPLVEVPFSAVNRASMLVRASGDPSAVGSAVGAALRQLEPELPRGRVRTLEQVMGTSLARPRSAMTLLLLFAAAALLLAVVGVYSTLAAWVNERTRELGVRAALGGTRGRLVRLVMGQGLGTVGAGLLLGLFGAAAASRLLATLLFETSPLDPASFAVAAVALLAAACAACLLPAWRAARLDPMTALREE